MDFSTDKLPYLYHSEYCDVAWTREFGGFFIAPNGVKYRYKNPDNWKRYSSSIKAKKDELNIKPTDLFHNLGICKVKKPWFGATATPLSLEVINDLLKGKLLNVNDMHVCDAPETINSLYVYDNTSGFYKQVVLSFDGSRTLLNSSLHTQNVIDEFGTHYFSRWGKMKVQR